MARRELTSHCREKSSHCKDCTVRGSTLLGRIDHIHIERATRWRHRLLKLNAKSTLYLKGSKPDFAYSVKNGWIMLYRNTQKGKRQILRFALPGDLIALKTNDDGVISHSAATIDNAVLCSFEYATIKDIIANESSVSPQFFSMEARDMELYHQYLTGLGQQDASERIAFLLLELFQRSRLQDATSYDATTNSIHFPLTQEEIGDAVGLTSIHVNRIINHLKKSKIISCAQKRLSILNVDKLAELTEFDLQQMPQAR